MTDTRGISRSVMNALIELQRVGVAVIDSGYATDTKRKYLENVHQAEDALRDMGLAWVGPTSYRTQEKE